MSTVREIRLVENDDGHWTARDLDAELSAQGETREEALDALDEVVRAATEDGGREPTDAELRALGIDPETNGPNGEDVPDVLR